MRCQSCYCCCCCLFSILLRPVVNIVWRCLLVTSERRLSALSRLNRCPALPFPLPLPCLPLATLCKSALFGGHHVVCVMLRLFGLHKRALDRALSAALCGSWLSSTCEARSQSVCVCDMCAVCVWCVRCVCACIELTQLSTMSMPLPQSASSSTSASSLSTLRAQWNAVHGNALKTLDYICIFIQYSIDNEHSFCAYTKATINLALIAHHSELNP